MRLEDVALVDDTPTELVLAKNSLEAAGLRVHGTSDQHEVERVIERPSKALFLDARLDAFDSMTAVDVARAYARANPGRPIFHISNFFGNDFRDRMKWQVSPLTPFHTVKKSELTDERMREWIGEQLQAAAEALPRNRLGRVSIELPKIDEVALAALSLSPQEWQDLSQDQQDHAADAVADCVTDYVRGIFANSSAEWLVVGGPDARVLRWSNVPEHQPSGDVLEEIEANEGCVPFVFLRQLEVDSISLAGIPWPGSGQNEFYPALRCKFPDSKRPEPVDLLFDTGADASYISSALARGMGLELGKFSLFGFRLAQTIKYREHRYDITIVDGVGVANGSTDIRVVRNWESTLGEGKKLEGLLSNRVLVDLKVAVRICGRTRTVSLADEEEEA